MRNSSCGISSYLNLCASSKIVLLVPGFGLNLFVLVSLVTMLLGHGRNVQIKRNVAAFILGSTLCNLVNLTVWPLTIHWKTHGKWLLGEELCEIMVKTKHFTSSASFHYVSFISFSVYLTVVCGLSKLVDSGVFLVLQLLVPFVPVLIKEICQWGIEGRIEHLDPQELTCFSYMNDQAMRILLLLKLVFFIPLNFYFYAHILFTTFRSAKQMQRSQLVNKKLAKIFGVISLLTLSAHIPGGVFTLMEKLSICQETVKEFLMDLPLLSSPVVLLCTNKELRTHCLKLLKHRASVYYKSRFSSSPSGSTRTPEDQQGDTSQSEQGDTSQSQTSVPADVSPSDGKPVRVSVLTTNQHHHQFYTREFPHIYTLPPPVAMEMRHVNGHLPAELHLFPTRIYNM